MINTKIQDQIYHTKIQFVTDFRQVLDISKKILNPKQVTKILKR